MPWSFRQGSIAMKFSNTLSAQWLECPVAVRPFGDYPALGSTNTTEYARRVRGIFARGQFDSHRGSGLAFFYRPSFER